MRLALRGRVLDLDAGRPLLMGILNASSESFSGDGALARRGPDALAARGLELADQGAAIVDVGGESGVTHLAPISAEEEVARVVPVVERLVDAGVAVSVDTWKPAVAGAALGAGAAMINDVSGLQAPAIADLCAETGAALVVMHTRAAPKEKGFPDYDDVVADVGAFLRERVAAAVKRGVRPDQIVVDPGPDFAKTPGETVAVLRSLGELREDLGRPVLLAASRKDFVGALTGRPPGERLPGTLAAVAQGIDAGADIVRVHDVAAVADFLRVRAALRGESDVEQLRPLDEHLRRGEAA